MRPIEPLWVYLEQAPLAFGPDKHPDLAAVLRRMVLDGSYALEEAARTRDLCPPSAPFLNSGVVLFRRCDSVAELFEVWQREWRMFRGRDQLALMRAVALTGIEVARLPLQFNAYAGAGLAEKEVTISHYHLVPSSIWAKQNRVSSLAIRIGRKISGSPLVPSLVKSWLKNLYRKRAVFAHELREEILGRPEYPAK